MNILGQKFVYLIACELFHLFLHIKFYISGGNHLKGFLGKHKNIYNVY